MDRNSGQYKAPFNTINNEARVFTYKDTAVVTPNSDTPYSMLWLDLRAEPMVISVPAVPKQRYYSVQLIDGNAYNYGYIGSRATGIEAGDYLVAGPGWKGDTPAGIRKVFQSTTPFALTIFRTQLFDAKDMPNVEKVQAGYKAQPLSAFLKQPAPPAAPKIDFVPATTAGIKANFYEYLDAALAVRARDAGGQGDPRQARQHRHRAGQDLRVQGSLAGTQGGRAARDEGGRRQGRQVPGLRHEGRQRLEGRLALRRPRVLQRRLAEARRCREGRHLRQRRRRGDVPDDARGRDRRDDRHAASTTTRSPSPPGSSRR